LLRKIILNGTIVIISLSFEGKNLFERINMAAQTQLDVTRKHIVPIGVLLKTPKEYDYSKKTYFKSEIMI
jgi:hypothetical protein